MDFQRENNTPLDRIDENMLRRIMREEYGDRNRSHCGSCGANDCDYPIYRDRNGDGEHGRRGDERMRPASARPSSNCSVCCPICGSSKGCSCRSSEGSRDRFYPPRLENVPLAMVYSPAQEWRNLYEPEIGFERGTIFKELDFPWYPTRCSSQGCKNK